MKILSPSILYFTMAGCCVVVILLLLGSAILNTSIVKGVFIEQIKLSTHRTLRIDGELKVSLIPHPAIVLHNVSLSNAYDFNEDEFISAKTAELQIRFWPLLFRKFIISRCVLRNWSLMLSRNKQGRYNWKAPEAINANETSLENQNQTAKSLLFEQVQLEQGRIIWQDVQNDTALAADNINLQMDNFALGEAVDINLTWNMQMQARRWDIHSRATLYADTNFFKLSNVLLEAGMLTDKPTPIAKAIWQLQAVEFDRIQQILKPTILHLDSPPLQAMLEFNGHNLPTQYEIKGKLRIPTFNLRDWLQRWDIRNATLQNQGALQQIGLNFDFQLSPDVFKLNNLNLQLDDSKLTANAEINNFKQVQLDFSVLVDRLDVDRYWQTDQHSPPILSVAELMQEIAPKFAAFNKLKSMTTNGKIELQNLKLRSVELQGLTFTVKSNNGVAAINQAQNHVPKN